MGETGYIAAMAQKVAKEIFNVFGWKLVGPRDQNWACATDAHELATHPSDAVFTYEDPYKVQRVYVNSDLKSYAKDTINKAKVAGALRTLALATECCNKSDAWQSLYVDKDYPYTPTGMLFVYNHDGEYDKDFDGMRGQIDDSAIPIARGTKLFVLGPQQIAYLATVANDIERLIGRKVIPADTFRFYYPDLIHLRPKTNRHDAASFEMLTGPWQLINFSSVSGGSVVETFIMYYAGKGDTPEEFQYVFDYFFRYQLLGDHSKVMLRLPFAHPEARVFFEKAIEQFSKGFYELPEMKARLAKIEFESLSNLITSFSETDLGMTRD